MKTLKRYGKKRFIQTFAILIITTSGCSKDLDFLASQESSTADAAVKRTDETFLQNKIQEDFDTYGPLPETKQISLSSGKTLYYTDIKGGNNVVLSIPGSGGDAMSSYYLFNHLNTLREQLGIRIISVEKNGLGSTPYDSTWTPQEYAKSCEELLNRLGIQKVILFSQSAGGLLLPFVAERLGDARVRSIHLGNSVSQYDDQDPLNGPLCAMPIEDVLNLYAFWADPTTDFSILFGQRDIAIAHNIPGLFESVNPLFRNAVRSGSLRWIEDELKFGCSASPSPVINNISAPVYIYHGTLDYMVPASIYPNKWKYVFPNASKIKMRIYEDEEHLSYLRNFEQVLLDMIGLDSKSIISKNGNNLVVNESAVDNLLKDGAVRGIVAWSSLDGQNNINN